jgi:hypothetical protein
MLTVAACLAILFFLPGILPVWNPNNGKLNTALDKEQVTLPLLLFSSKQVLLLLYSRMLTFFRLYIT